MYNNTNYISFSYRANDENTRNTDLSVDFNLEDADDEKLAKALKKWLTAIEAGITVNLK